MATLLISTKDNAELNFIKELLKKMKISSKELSDEEKEDMGLLKLINETDTSKRVSKEKIYAKLGRK